MTNSINKSFSSKMLMSIMFLAFLVLSMSPEMASASGFRFWEKLCGIYNCFFGNEVVIFIATVAIIFLGIGAFFGKLNWGLVIVVVIGIIIITGAMQLATAIADGASNGSAGCASASLTNC